MAGHFVLYQRLLDAIGGQTVGPVPGYDDGGSVNYKLMDRGAEYISGQPKAREQWLELMADMALHGHMTLKGPRGYACEQGAPAAHWYFNLSALLGVLKYALARADVEVIAVTKERVLDEVGLCRAFRWGKQVIMPAPRVKDQKGQVGQDDYRDVFLALALGETVNKKTSYWNHPQSKAVALMFELVSRDVFPPEVCRRRPLPRKMHLPILRRDLLGGGYLAWIEKTPESVKRMNKDGCNWVLCTPAGVSYGYDWKPLPEV